CYAISYTPLAGTEILAHFHGPAMKGDVAGPGVGPPGPPNNTHRAPPRPPPPRRPPKGGRAPRRTQHDRELKGRLSDTHHPHPPHRAASGDRRRRDPRPGTADQGQVQERASHRDHIDDPDDHHHDDDDGLAERRVPGLIVSVGSAAIRAALPKRC